jgi:hypothetical protein
MYSGIARAGSTLAGANAQGKSSQPFPGPKNGLERRAWQLYTICDKKKSAPKQKTNVKLMAILVDPHILEYQLKVRVQRSSKFSMVKSHFVWGARANSTISTRSKRLPTAEREN